MTDGASDHDEPFAPQLRPWLRRPRTVPGWVGLVVLMVVASALLLAFGLLAAVLALAAWAVRGAVWLIGTVIVWVRFGTWRRLHPYPYRLPPPLAHESRGAVADEAWMQTFPRAVGLVARTAGFLFAPLALLASLVGLVLPRLRARPYLAVFTVTALEAKLVGLGRNIGFFDDGRAVAVVPYDTFLREHFGQHEDFLEWWRDPDAPPAFAPSDAWNTPRRFSGLELGPYPDVLGLPGLALTALRRTRVEDLREIFVSQREIDDLGDPDLDGRADVAVIRIVRVDDEHDGPRRWIVQLPSTQTWHARAGKAPNDLTADFVALAMHETELTRAAVQAMRAAEIRSHEPVLVAGFSLGGMIAAQLADLSAREGFRVTHLVTAGSPIGRYRFPGGVRVLSLEHLLDPVPRLDGRENPIVPLRTCTAPEPGASSGASGRPGRRAGDRGDADEWITVKAGPPLPHGFSMDVLHHSPSYAETAGAIEAHPPAAEVAAYLEDTRPFFAGAQTILDYAAWRVGIVSPRAAVPRSLRVTADDIALRDRLRVTLRRVPGTIAVDIYPSRTGFPTAVLWSADVLVRSLVPWFERVARASVYRGLLGLLDRRGGIGLHLRLQAKTTPGVTWEATMQRLVDGRWRERVDVSFDSDSAHARWADLLMPQGWASTVTYYESDAFE